MIYLFEEREAHAPARDSQRESQNRIEYRTAKTLARPERRSFRLADGSPLIWETTKPRP